MIVILYIVLSETNKNGQIWYYECLNGYIWYLGIGLGIYEICEVLKGIYEIHP